MTARRLPAPASGPYPARAMRLLVLALLVGACRAPDPAREPAPPNLVLFVVDDLGWQDTAVPFSGTAGPFQEHFRTPALAELARHGLAFSDAHAQAVCTPSRLSMLTGLNSARHGTTNWVLDVARETSGQTETLGPPPRWRASGWEPGTPTLPAQLRTAGYRTIHVGKAHFGAIGTPGADPLNLGFDVNVAGHAAGAPGSYQGENGYDKPGREEPTVWGVPGLEAFAEDHVHLTDALTSRALEEVESAVADGRPFYLHLAHYAVHVPLEPHDPYTARYREAGLEEPEARYAAMVEGVDASLGALVATLERLGVAENTLIAFTSDNGGLSAHARGRSAIGGGRNTHNAPLREGKGSAYEGGTRIPLLFAWARSAPDDPVQARLGLRTGRTDAATLCEDLFPTLLAIAGAACPPDVDGLDLSGVLRGGTLPERSLVFHYPHVWGPKSDGYQPHSAIRRGRWKAIWFYGPERWELYDLQADLGEREDLAERQPDVLSALAKELTERLTTLEAPLPLDRIRGGERGLGR
jgi:arylsulfatase A-like enzyme